MAKTQTTKMVVLDNDEIAFRDEKIIKEE